VSNHPITPQASSQVNHDQVRSDLIEPEAMLANGEVHQLAGLRNSAWAGSFAVCAVA
jgi:hypothetical protein